MKEVSVNEVSAKKGAYLWNTMNSMLNAGMSAVLLLVVNRVCGEDNAGIFTLAFSIAQLMVTIGYFELRSYQVTDINDKYTQNQYYSFKVLSCLAMLLVSFVYVFAGGYGKEKAILIILLCVLKMLDAYEEYYVTLYQKENRLDIGAKYSSVRLMAAIAVFVLLLVITKNMCAAALGAILVSVIIIYFMFDRKARSFFEVRLSGDAKSIAGILFACLPLFVGSYLMLYVGNAPKYAIDHYLELKYQTYYGILYMPSFVINLLSGFIFKPLLVDMSTYYYCSREKYKRIICKILLLLLVIFFAVFGAAYLAGIPVLSILYGVDLNGYRTDLMIIIFGGAISALGVIICYMITIMRCQKWLTISYGATALAAYILSPLLVKEYAIRGASMGFLLFNIMRVGLFIVILYVCGKRENKKK